MKAKEELKEIKGKTIEELSSQLEENKIKLANLRRDLVADKLKKPSEIVKTKKKIARLKTVIREKIVQELSKKEKNDKKK